MDSKNLVVLTSVSRPPKPVTVRVINGKEKRLTVKNPQQKKKPYTPKPGSGGGSPTKKQLAARECVCAIATITAAAAMIDTNINITANGTIAATTTTVTTTTGLLLLLLPFLLLLRLEKLVILPGSSGKLSKDFKEFLFPALHQRFEVRLREAKKWRGLCPINNAIDVCSSTEKLVPWPTFKTTDATVEVKDWYIMGCSFESRVVTEIAYYMF